MGFYATLKMSKNYGPIPNGIGPWLLESKKGTPLPPPQFFAIKLELSYL
jgi:hypothetical protein